MDSTGTAARRRASQPFRTRERAPHCCPGDEAPGRDNDCPQDLKE
ncbi:MAG TPA: hypothetical protein VET88_01810 [Gammaproteobacteria bacterium]|nr:hypothetical protein [Gammaproteobacteria bacterium]